VTVTDVVNAPSERTPVVWARTLSEAPEEIAVLAVVAPAPDVPRLTWLPPQLPVPAFHVAPTQAVNATVGPPEFTDVYVSAVRSSDPVLTTLKYCEVGSRVMRFQLRTNGVPVVGEPLVVAPAAPHDALPTVSLLVALPFSPAHAGVAAAIIKAAAAAATEPLSRKRFTRLPPSCRLSGAATGSRDAAEALSH
jgi:hypothetical protein